MTYTKDNISLLMSGWTQSNLLKLYDKMTRKGIDQGGILSTSAENIVLYDYLTEKRAAMIKDIKTGYMGALAWCTWDCPDFEAPEHFEVSDNIEKLVSNIVDHFIEITPIVDIAAYLEHFDAYHVGHDLYLTSHRHGAGFWDRGLDSLGDRLTQNAEQCKELHVFYQDGYIYVE